MTTSDIPIGAYKGARPAFTGGSCYDGDNQDSYLLSTLNAVVPLVPVVGRATFPDAVAVLRTALGSSPDGSVVVVTLGGFTNISALMQSAANTGGDGYPSGQTLWDTKVIKMVSQTSGFPGSPYTQSPFTQAGPGFNISCDAPAAKYAFEHNGAVPIIGNPMQATMNVGGCYDGTGAGCTTAMPANSPTRIATGIYRAIPGSGFTIGSGNYGRPAWDPTTVFYALVGTADPGGGAYFTLSANGTLSIVATSPSSQTWSTATASNHYFAIDTLRYSGQIDAINLMLQDDYVPSSTPAHPRLLLNDTVKDTWDPGSYPGNGTSGRLAAITDRVSGGNTAATADWGTLRTLAPTGGTPSAFGNVQDEASLDQVMAYGLSYLIYHRAGNDASANPYAAALYNGLKFGTAYGTTYPAYNVTQIAVSSNVATVTLSSAPGAEITAGALIGVWGCASGATLIAAAKRFYRSAAVRSRLRSQRPILRLPIPAWWRPAPTRARIKRGRSGLRWRRGPIFTIGVTRGSSRTATQTK